MLSANRETSCGDRVLLRSVNGTVQAPDDAKPSENYWRLVGTGGVVVKTWRQADFSMDRPRHLVKLDQDVTTLGLHCHNEIANSLWILETDIVSISPTGQ